jgi:hypothetical protein
LSTFALAEPPAPNLEFARPASAERLKRAVAALNAHGFVTEIVDDRDTARRRVLEAIPQGAEVHSALSETMRELGLTADIDESGRYDSVRSRLMRLDRTTQHREMRKLAAAPDYIIGSANAITEEGEILVSSGTGSQLGPYASTAGQVLVVVGHQKVVRDVAEGMRRIKEYCLPMEFERMKSIGRAGTVLAKTLILHMEMRGRVRVIVVRDTIGY